jgi:adenine phosphoribosyltransferase
LFHVNAAAFAKGRECETVARIPLLAKMDAKSLAKLRITIRDVPDFPKPGILFKDITPVLADPALLDLAISGMIEFLAGARVDKVVGIDARGFIFGALIAQKLGAGFIPVRKKGKLPFQTRGIDYTLEYGTNSVEMHVDAIQPGERVVLADDLLATGGTAAAAQHLIREAGGELLGSLFFIELGFLDGRNKLGDTGPVHSLITF